MGGHRDASQASAGRISASVGSDGLLFTLSGTATDIVVGSGGIELGEGFTSGTVTVTDTDVNGGLEGLAGFATAIGTTVNSGGRQFVNLSGAAYETQITAGDFTGMSFVVVGDGASGSLVEIACYAAGTHIATPAGAQRSRRCGSRTSTTSTSNSTAMTCCSPRGCRPKATSIRATVAPSRILKVLLLIPP